MEGRGLYLLPFVCHWILGIADDCMKGDATLQRTGRETNERMQSRNLKGKTNAQSIKGSVVKIKKKATKVQLDKGAILRARHCNSFDEVATKLEK